MTPALCATSRRDRIAKRGTECVDPQQEDDEGKGYEHLLTPWSGHKEQQQNKTAQHTNKEPKKSRQYSTQTHTPHPTPRASTTNQNGPQKLSSSTEIEEVTQSSPPPPPPAPPRLSPQHRKQSTAKTQQNGARPTAVGGGPSTPPHCRLAICDHSFTQIGMCKIYLPPGIVSRQREGISFAVATSPNVHG